jgi:hypothetical protein
MAGHQRSHGAVHSVVAVVKAHPRMIMRKMNVKPRRISRATNLTSRDLIDRLGSFFAFTSNSFRKLSQKSICCGIINAGKGILARSYE